MSLEFDTICAIATPLSVGGIGVIRVSGEDAFNIVQKFFDKKIKPKMINHGWFVYENKKIDEVVVLPFVAPHSFTGENVAEIQTHGSPVVINEILNILLKSGARLADRGEFTKRAFLNHKIDLSQAEAVLDLINSKTSKSAIGAAGNLSGALKIKIDLIKTKISELLGKIIASLDFPEDVREVEYSEITEKLANYIKDIDEILKNAKSHNILRQGIKIAIVGRPNAGKSSLFNALLNLNRAIVTDIAGTTRDTITETIEIEGVSATLIDTAGIREKSSDIVENIGIEQSRAAIDEADIVLCLYDGTKGILEEDREIFELAKNKETILIATKADLNKAKEGLLVSSTTKEGLDYLKSEIYKKAVGVNLFESEYLTNQRQQECLKNARNSLNLAKEAADNFELQDLISIDIKDALLALGEISGEVITDDILNNIFENFCIGK